MIIPISLQSCDASPDLFFLGCSKVGKLVEELFLIRFEYTVRDHNVFERLGEAGSVFAVVFEDFGEISRNRTALWAHPGDYLGQLVEHVNRDSLSEALAAMAEHEFTFDILADRVEFFRVEFAVTGGGCDENGEGGAQVFADLASDRCPQIGFARDETGKIDGQMILKELAAVDHFSIWFDEARDSVAAKLSERSALMADSAEDWSAWARRDFKQGDPAAGGFASSSSVVDDAEQFVERDICRSVWDIVVFVFWKILRRRELDAFFEAHWLWRCFKIWGAAGNPEQKRHRRILLSIQYQLWQRASARAIRATDGCAA